MGVSVKLVPVRSVSTRKNWSYGHFQGPVVTCPDNPDAYKSPGSGTYPYFLLPSFIQSDINLQNPSYDPKTIVATYLV